MSACVSALVLSNSTHDRDARVCGRPASLTRAPAAAGAAASTQVRDSYKPTAEAHWLILPSFSPIRCRFLSAIQIVELNHLFIWAPTGRRWKADSGGVSLAGGRSGRGAAAATVAKSNPLGTGHAALADRGCVPQSGPLVSSRGQKALKTSTKRFKTVG